MKNKCHDKIRVRSGDITWKRQQSRWELGTLPLHNPWPCILLSRTIVLHPKSKIHQEFKAPCYHFTIFANAQYINQHLVARHPQHSHLQLEITIHTTKRIRSSWILKTSRWKQWKHHKAKAKGKGSSGANFQNQYYKFDTAMMPKEHQSGN